MADKQSQPPGKDEALKALRKGFKEQVKAHFSVFDSNRSLPRRDLKSMGLKSPADIFEGNIRNVVGAYAEAIELIDKIFAPAPRSQA